VFYFANTFVQDASLVTLLCSLSCYLNISPKSLPRNRLAAGSTAPLVRCTSSSILVESSNLWQPSAPLWQSSNSLRRLRRNRLCMSLRAQLPITIHRCAMPAELFDLFIYWFTEYDSFLSELMANTITDVRNSIRNSCQANMSESQCDRKRHLNFDCYIGESY
jgi:hypothetical protein